MTIARTIQLLLAVMSLVFLLGGPLYVTLSPRKLDGITRITGLLFAIAYAAVSIAFGMLR